MIWLPLVLLFVQDTPALPVSDPRDIRTGLVLPDEGYCDQPYVVHTADGAWLCVMTTGPGHEGAGGQHVVSLRSEDHGRTWSEPVDVEPADGPEASWGMPLVTPAGRVYVFYVYNGDRVTGRRADMLGWYCYRYSDDGGRSWSAERYRLPLRLTAADRGNDWEGAVQIFWGIGKPIAVGDDALFGFTKIGRYMLEQSEGWFFRSPNVLSERDPAAIEWELLPEGDHGLRAPEHGSIQSEQNLVALSDGSLYCMYRTTMGYPCHAYSRDGGRTWTAPEAATYTPGGRRFKHPRACPRIWRTRGGRFLFWFHNNGEKDWSPGTRNPGWIAGGVERDGFIHWSQPEVLLYDRDPQVRISYPDLIEEDGRTWITETQKSVARVHEIDPELLEGLWSQGRVAAVPRRGLVLETSGGAGARLPALGDVDGGGGFSLELWLDVPDPADERVLARAGDGRGLSLVLRGGALALVARDGEAETSWSSDPGLLGPGGRHHVVVTADGGPGILTWVVDGVLCDGGAERVRGWQRFRAATESETRLGRAAQAASGAELKLGTAGAVLRLRAYDRPLRTSEAVASFRAGP